MIISINKKAKNNPIFVTLIVIFLINAISCTSGSNSTEITTPPQNTSSIPGVGGFISSSNNSSADIKEYQTNNVGEILISSDELRNDLTIKVVELGTNNPISNINVQCNIKSGEIEAIVYDTSNIWATALFRGNPNEQSNRIGQFPYKTTKGFLQKNCKIIVSGTLLIVGVISIAIAELQYIDNVYKMSEFHLTNIAHVGQGDYGYFRCTIDELSNYLKSNFAGKMATIKIITSVALLGIPGKEWVSVFTGYIQEGINANTAILTSLLNNVVDRSLYGTTNGSTQIWVKLDNWDSVANNFIYDVDITVMPNNFDDQYDASIGNDSFSNAINLKTNDENCLIVYQNDPDYYKFNLNPGDNWNGKVNFLQNKGNINLTLYDPNGNTVDSSSTTSNTETVSITNASVAGYYVLKVYQVSGEWNSNMYNLNVSSTGGESITEFDQIRLVLTWGSSPTDLDSHLITPNIDGESYHIYWGNKMNSNDFPFCELDVDDRNGIGPETTTITSFYPGTYKYYVYNYSNETELINSSAKVAVYDKFGLLLEKSIPTSGNGIFWNVFEIDGNNSIINEVNTLSNNHM